jgi:hypothetical protein
MVDTYYITLMKVYTVPDFGGGAVIPSRSAPVPR